MLVCLLDSSSLEQWFREAEQNALLFRMSVLVCIGCVTSMMSYETMEPWLLLAFGGDRRPNANHKLSAAEFCKKSSCCVKPGVAKVMHEAVGDHPEFVLPAVYQKSALHTAWALAISLAPVERCHARNQRRADLGKS